MHKLTLISFKLCPYVQRVAIALREKGMPFDLVYVDLEQKPDWFVALSPLGKVPLLKVDTDEHSETLFESTAILEYIEDLGVGPALHPADPLERARHRAWMEFGSAVLGDIWSIEIATNEAAFQAAGERLHSKLGRLEQEVGGGPYFSGQGFSLVDAVFAPAFRYFEVFDRHTVTSMLAGYPKLLAWKGGLAERPSVQHAVTPDYHELLKDFLAAKRALLVTKDQVATT